MSSRSRPQDWFALMRGRELKFPLLLLLAAWLPVRPHARAGVEIAFRAVFLIPVFKFALMRGRELKSRIDDYPVIRAQVRPHARAGVEMRCGESTGRR